ncbi:MAG: M67 family metallopeptidase [Deltaproteobacteria bacterium]|nr:M67 family metallopeptidase [Deltaproteobacteria bacterium]
MLVIILNEVKKVIYEHAHKTYPQECCGFLYGTEHPDRTIILSKPVDNTQKNEKERRYQISSLDYIKAEQFAIQNNLALLGVYHSHPDHPAMPSDFDTQHALPFFSYLIVSIVNKEAKEMNSWRLNDERKFVEEILVSKQKTIPQITLNQEVHYG